MNGSGPELRELLEQQQAMRLTQRGVVRVVELPEPTYGHAFLIPGSILIAWAYSPEGLAAAADAVAQRKDPGALLVGDYEGVKVPPEGRNPLETIPAISAVRYRDRDLLTGIVLPESPRAIGATMVPWVGSRLRHDNFSIVSWLNPGAEPLACLIVLNPPELDPQNRAIIEALPGDTGEVGIGSAGVLGDVVRFVGEVVAERVVNWVVDQAVAVGRAAAGAAADAYNQAGQDAANAYARMINRARGLPVIRGAGVPGFGPGDEASPYATVEELLARRVKALKQLTDGRNGSQA
jgi:hypothetical protein